MKNLTLSVVLASAALSAFSSAGAPANSSVAHVQRTMKAMEESTTNNPAHVRVLFYGQSIVAQPWTKLVEARLTNRYPTVRFEFANLAIGGYEAENLIRTSESDLYPFYPDLLFFHDYGSLAYYEEIVRRVRERTTAEIVLWSSHLNRRQDPVAMLRQRDARTLGIAAVADRLETAYVDLNRKWSEMMIGRGYTADDLLADGIHMKIQCGAPALPAYAGFIAGELVRLPNAEPDAASGTIREIAWNDPAVKHLPDGTLELAFTGNRVVAVSDGTGALRATAKLLLDGRDVADFAEMYVNTRPSAIVNWMPMIKCVGRCEGARPVAEKWTLTYLDGTGANGQRIHYRIDGSVTGFDGEGWNTNDFTSVSGRATIKASDFHVWQYSYAQDLNRVKSYGEKAYAKVGDKVTWETKRLFADPFVPAPGGAHVVLVQNCANAAHRLTLRPQGGPLGIAKFIVYAPNPKWAAFKRSL